MKTKTQCSVGVTGIIFLLAVSGASAATHYVSLGNSNATPPYTNWATAATNIQDAINVARTNDVVLVTNGVYPGGVTVTNLLALVSVNGPESTVIDAGGKNRCVSLEVGGASLTGFTVTNGLGAGGPGGGVTGVDNSFVTNCVITGNQGGGACQAILYNCTLSGNSATAFAFDPNGGAYYCTLYNCTLIGNSTADSAVDSSGGAAHSTLYNCTLSDNSAPNGSGGGANACTLYNCTLSGNSAFYIGGGADASTLYNCALSGNSSYERGGGASDSGLYNCTLTGNSSFNFDGGVYKSALFNCIVYFNTDSFGEPNYDTDSTFYYCCTTPLPTNGVGNISVPPLFVDPADGDFHLQSNSPCINSGNNAYVYTTTDLDGNARIVSGTVDIGAYEYQGAGSVISYAWLQQYGLPTDGSVDGADLDGTGFTVYQDWVAGLNPTNALSVLALFSPTPTNNPAGLVIRWESVTNINYFVQRSTNLAAQPAFTTLRSNIVGQAGTTSYIDTNATGLGPFFYRVGVTAP
jgi:hypothetical protein